jgi:hypothetical protein
MTVKVAWEVSEHVCACDLWVEKGRERETPIPIQTMTVWDWKCVCERERISLCLSLSRARPLSLHITHSLPPPPSLPHPHRYGGTRLFGAWILCQVWTNLGRGCVWAILLHQGLHSRHEALKESQTKGEILFLRSKGKTDGHMPALFTSCDLYDVLIWCTYSWLFFYQVNGRIIKQVPLPTVTYHLTEMVKKLRTVVADSAEMNKRKDLYRGMSNVCIADGFLADGGTELV